MIEEVPEVCFLDQRKNRAYSRFDQIKKIEGRIDYLEGVIYQLFQLTEQILEKMQKRNDDDETAQTSTHADLVAFMTVMGDC